MQNEQAKLKTKIQKKEEDIKQNKNKISELQNNSMTTEERIRELNKIAEVCISCIQNHIIYLSDFCFILEFKR